MHGKKPGGDLPHPLMHRKILIGNLIAMEVTEVPELCRIRKSGYTLVQRDTPFLYFRSGENALNGAEKRSGGGIETNEERHRR